MIDIWQWVGAWILGFEVGFSVGILTFAYIEYKERGCKINGDIKTYSEVLRIVQRQEQKKEEGDTEDNHV